MQTAGPVDGDIAFSSVEPSSPFHAPTRADTAEFEKTIKDRAIVPDVILGLLLCIRFHVVGVDFLKKVHIFIGMELGHLKPCRRFCALHDVSSFSFHRDIQQHSN